MGKPRPERDWWGDVRILNFTTLFPNVSQPAHGIFVETRLRHLLAAGSVEASIVAPVPWFPSRNRRFGTYGGLAKVPPVESRAGLTVHHPRYPVIPKVGMSVAPTLLYLAVRGYVRRVLQSEGDIDLIDAHYFYPDGVAAVLLGRELGKPVVITGRGTDINLIPRYALPRYQLLWAATRAAGLITVCHALKDELVALGVPSGKVQVLRNGVDLDVFRPLDRDAERQRLGLSGPTLLSVGGLIERKGHHLIIEALRELDGFTLLIAGSGPERAALERLAATIGVGDRVRFLGLVPHDRLAQLYNAAHALVLGSSREGWANVLLEAMACGTPVVATDVWGTAEVVAAPAAGVLVKERSPAALAEGVRRLWTAPPARAETRAYAEGFAWDPTTKGQLELFASILTKTRPDGQK